MGASRFGTGVSWHTRYKRFVATIGINGRKQHLGYFDTSQEAAQAYETARLTHPALARGRRGWGNSEIIRGVFEREGQEPPVGCRIEIGYPRQVYELVRYVEHVTKDRRTVRLQAWVAPCAVCGALVEHKRLAGAPPGFLRTCKAHRHKRAAAAGKDGRLRANRRRQGLVADGSITVLRRGPGFLNEPVFGGKALSLIGDEDDPLMTPQQTAAYYRFMSYDAAEQRDKAAKVLGLTSSRLLPDDWVQRMPAGLEDEWLEGLV